MKVEIGAPVVLLEEQPALWHLPAPLKQLQQVDVSIDEGLQRMVATWPTLCLQTPGEVWVYEGFARQRTLCRGCAFVNQQAPHRVPDSEREAIVHHEALRAELGTFQELEAA